MRVNQAWISGDVKPEQNSTPQLKECGYQGRLSQFNAPVTG